MKTPRNVKIGFENAANWIDKQRWLQVMSDQEYQQFLHMVLDHVKNQLGSGVLDGLPLFTER